MVSVKNWFSVSNVSQNLIFSDKFSSQNWFLILLLIEKFRLNNFGFQYQFFCFVSDKNIIKKNKVFFSEILVLHSIERLTCLWLAGINETKNTVKSVNNQIQNQIYFQRRSPACTNMMLWVAVIWIRVTSIRNEFMLLEFKK